MFQYFSTTVYTLCHYILEIPGSLGNPSQRWEIPVLSTLYQSNDSIQAIYYYRTLAKEGPWAVHLTLGQDWGVGRYSRYQYCI